MIDFFCIFTKGGIVLFCFQTTSDIIAPSLNSLIKTVILNEQLGSGKFDQNSLSLQFKLDNEFDLVFVVVYQKDIQLSYADKFLDDINLEFRDKFKNKLHIKGEIITIDIQSTFEKIFAETELRAKSREKLPKQMKAFNDSRKSKKAVAFMIKRRSEDNHVKSLKQNTKLTKKPRVWNLEDNFRDVPKLEFSEDKSKDFQHHIKPDSRLVGQMHGIIKDLDVEYKEIDFNEFQSNKPNGIMNIFIGLLASKSVTQETMHPALDKMKDHLISKNVAAEIANKLCASVAVKLEGRIINTFESIANVVKNTFLEFLEHVLALNRNINLLRDCLQAKQEGRPYVIVFCGVNGVGKTTNLAKICFWLIENNLSVLIAACDTFRAGAVEQLKTHARHLNALHPPDRRNGKTMVQLYEKGYGKDTSKIAMDAIRYAKESKIHVVLIDTAGRMQDNEPLMRSLGKLIDFNAPDFILFVGEALVGNEAVNQLVKFNQALEDHGNSLNPRKIDGVLLTKFDTVDDKVGAAISMAYVTGKPIVFVGTGQTYVDLKALNVKAVVNALMK